MDTSRMYSLTPPLANLIAFQTAYMVFDSPQARNDNNNSNNNDNHNNNNNKNNNINNNDNNNDKQR